MAGGGSGGGGSSNTVTQTQQIPDWQKDYALENESIAAGLASRPYPTYQGQLIAGFTPLQQQGIQMAQDASTAYQPYLDRANQMTQQASKGWNQQSADTVNSYMNPYVMASLAPQLQQLDIAQNKNRMQIGSSAAQAGAFGDARMSVDQRLNDYYSGQNRAGVIGQGYNQAYNTGLGAFNADQARLLQGGGQEAALGQAAQQQGLAGSTALFGAGTQQQQLQQQQLSTAYQQFMNQQNWPVEQLNLRIAALANSPYNTQSQTNLSPANATAMNVGAFGALAGGLGSLFNGGGGSGGSAPGSSFNIFGSDIRIKKNIRRIGKTPLGIPVYLFNYLWDNILRIGVMAQEVEKIIPEAVLTNAEGIKFVNYDLVR